MSAKKVWTIIGVVLIGAGVVAANLYYRRDKGTSVTTETIKTRDLDAIVSASGKIQPKREVNISADTSGRVVDLAVNEGDRVKMGQFLLQIDPQLLKSAVQSGNASLQAAQMSLDQMRQAVQTARVQLDQAQVALKRQQDLWARQLTTRETLDNAASAVKSADSQLQEREHAADSQAALINQARASLDSAQYQLSKVRIVSPIDGIVTRRNIQEGETAVVGTMNNAGTVLLTLADMSVIQAEIEVDETNLPSIQIGQRGKVEIDAIPDKMFDGHVTEIGNSPIQSSTTTTTTSTTQATTFKVVVVLDQAIPEARPGFTCTADVTTATRKNVVSVPIPAVAVREVVFDANNQIVRQPPKESGRKSVEPTASAAELKPGQTRKETEGVFVLQNGRAVFMPIKVGIAGDKYFEVLSGLNAGDVVITGPYNSVRGMADGDPVKLQPPAK